MNAYSDTYSTSHIVPDDRRLFTRKPAHGTIVAKPVSQKYPAIYLELRDISVGGVSGWSSQAVHQGQAIDLSFPPEGFKCGFNTRGKVVRCEPSALGYRVAVEFDRLLGHTALNDSILIR